MRRPILTLVSFFLFIVVNIAQVPEKAEDISPLMISEMVPDVEINSIDGSATSLIEIVKEKPAVVLFYRGGWCPYCNRHLSAVGQAEEDIINLGYQIIGIGPDSPEYLSATVKKGELNYQLYSDGDGSLIKAMGLAFQAPERYGPRLSKYSADQNPGILPVPSVYVVGIDGTILFQYVSPNYKHRMSTDLLLEVLKELNKQ